MFYDAVKDVYEGMFVNTVVVMLTYLCIFYG